MSNNNNQIIDESRLENAQLVSDNLIIFQDYGVRVKCSKCGKWEEHSKDSKQANLLNQNHDMAQNWVCGECYKLVGQMTTGYISAGNPMTLNPQESVQERIAYHGSWNLAAQIVAAMAGKLDGEVEGLVEKSLEEWQKYFYEKLTNRK